MKFLTLFALLGLSASTDSSFRPSPENSGALIVGGSETKVGAYKWLVGLRSSRNGRSFCGGSLIDATHVLTAAHCISRWNSNPKWVSIGSHFLQGDVDGQYIKVKTRTVHPSYNSPINLANDYAILELMTPVQDIEPIALADQYGLDEIVGRNSTTSGWGTLSAGGSQSAVKMEVTVPLISNEKCELAYENNIHDTMICAGFDEGGKDACQGDSGGPLFTTREDGTQVLVGVVSWGRGCAWKDYPGVYARVCKALDFIREYAPNATFL